MIPGTETKQLIRVGIVEDDEDVRQGYAFLISQSGELICNSFASAELFLESMGSTMYDVVIMDVNLPGMTGIECTRILKEKSPQTHVMMFTVFENNENVFNALKAGASGYVLKHSTPSFILDSIRDLMQGGAPMSGQIARMVVASFKSQSKVENNPYKLSSREKDVLTQLAEGHRYKDIAEKLFISIATVRSHIFNIYEKLHVHNRTEAVKKWSSGE